MRPLAGSLVVGVGVVTLGSAAHASTVGVTFSGGGVDVTTNATPDGQEGDTSTDSSSLQDRVVEAEGSSSSGLVSSAGSFRGSISDVVPTSARNNPAFTIINFAGSVDLAQSELGGTAFGTIETGTLGDPGSLFITVTEAAVFDISIQGGDGFDQFSFELTPLFNSGAGIEEDTLLPGVYAIDIFATLNLAADEFERSASFDVNILLFAADGVIPLPGAAGLGLLGMGVLAARRRRTAA